MIARGNAAFDIFINPISKIFEDVQKSIVINTKARIEISDVRGRTLNMPTIVMFDDYNNIQAFWNDMEFVGAQTI